MTKTLVFALMMLIATPMCAGQYIIYNVIGQAHMKQKGRNIRLQARSTVTDATTLVLGEASAVNVLDEKANRMYSFTAEGTHLIGDLLKGKQHSSKNLSKQYMAYLSKQLFAKGSDKMAHPDTYMQAVATAYRSASTDSMLLAKVGAVAAKAAGMRSVEPLLTNKSTVVETDYNVGFQLMDCNTGRPLEGKVEKGQSCYVKVSNHTAEMLYVNVLNIDAAGNKYLVLPVDSACTCAHLLVPPMCEVGFESEPMIFGDEPSDESFLLVATPQPADFSILMNPIRPAAHADMKAGLARRQYQVR